MNIFKDIIGPAVAGVAAIIGIGTGISYVKATSEASNIPGSIWRCPYDGLRFPSENALIDHILWVYKPSPPNDPRKSPSRVFLTNLPSFIYTRPGMAPNGLGLIRIINVPPVDDFPAWKIEILAMRNGMVNWEPLWYEGFVVEFVSAPASPNIFKETTGPDGIVSTRYSRTLPRYIRLTQHGLNEWILL
jgi:hypothetical protein